MQAKHFMDIVKAKGFFARLKTDQLIAVPGRYCILNLNVTKGPVHGVRMLMVGPKHTLY